ncbi:MAG: hypothetical protein ACTSVV_08795 [Promethearchaeota archaeon]
MKERYCPICDNKLDIEDFKKNNNENYLKIWNSKFLEIPCCQCYELLLNIEENHDFLIPTSFDSYKAWKILKNLHKLGFISEQIRDKKMKEFSEKKRKFAANTLMRYFLV